MNTPHDLTGDLRALPEVTAPPEIAANVLARIARIEPAAPVKPLSGTARVGATVADWLSWLLLGASAAVLTVGLFAGINWFATIRSFSAMLGPTDLLQELVPLATSVLLCLLLYLGGLALPIVRVRRPR